MNAHPHSHHVLIERRYPTLDWSWDNDWFVIYGDTRVYLCGGWRDPLGWSKEKQQRVIGRAVRTAIQRHDTATQRAALKAQRANRAIWTANLDMNRWGSEQLAERK